MKKVLFLLFAAMITVFMVSCESDTATEHFVNVKVDGSAADYQIGFTIEDLAGNTVLADTVMGRNLVKLDNDDLYMHRREETGYFKIDQNKNYRITFDVHHFRENKIAINPDSSITVTQWSHFVMGHADGPLSPGYKRVIYPFTLETTDDRFNGIDIDVNSFSEEGRNDWSFIFKVSNVNSADFIDFEIAKEKVLGSGM